MWEIVLEGMSWVGEKRRLKDLPAPVDSHGFRCEVQNYPLQFDLNVLLRSKPKKSNPIRSILI
jgi:hypothetical protein